MPIYSGNKQVAPYDISRVWVGADKLVYERQGYEPLTFTGNIGTTSIYIDIWDKYLPEDLDVYYRKIDIYGTKGEWTSWLKGKEPGQSSTITINEGEAVQVWNKSRYWKSTSMAQGYVNFSVEGNCIVSGKLSSLINYKSLYKGCFARLFWDCQGIVACEIEFDDTLAESCYDYMFYECKNLEKMGSVLPAEVIPASAYNGMFNTCSKLANPPDIYARELNYGSMKYMFRSCKNLHIRNTESEEAWKFFYCPDTSAQDCVLGMFEYTGGTYKSDPVADTMYYWY